MDLEGITSEDGEPCLLKPWKQMTDVCSDSSADAFLFQCVSVADVMDDLYNYINPHNGKHSPMISKETLDIVLANKDVCNASPVPSFGNTGN